jgi:hypothetical protein
MLGLVLLATSASAAPKTYVFTGKLTASRGQLFDMPMVGDVRCSGVGLANLTVMSGRHGARIPPPYYQYPPRTMTAVAAPWGCAGHVAGKEITTTGAGVGGAFVIPPNVFSKPLPSYVPVVGIRYATPIIQIATSFRVSGPAPTTMTPPGGLQAYLHPPAAFHAFKKGAWMTQTGRADAMFTWCWGNPDCVRLPQGTKPMIVKYTGGGNGFGGTMAYVVEAGPNVSSVAFGAAGGPVAFEPFKSTGSRPTGRGYGIYRKDVGAPGPIWAKYQAMDTSRPRVAAGKVITMVTAFLGNNNPPGIAYHYGFPWTTMTVLARNTGTVAGNPRTTTVTAKGGDTVTAMGQRNISLVAGGMTFAKHGIGFSENQSEIARMYLPEPSRAAQQLAGACGLLAIAAARRRTA